jgi:hypothetical protein
MYHRVGLIAELTRSTKSNGASRSLTVHPPYPCVVTPSRPIQNYTESSVSSVACSRVGLNGAVQDSQRSPPSGAMWVITVRSCHKRFAEDVRSLSTTQSLVSSSRYTEETRTSRMLSRFALTPSAHWGKRKYRAPFFMEFE